MIESTFDKELYLKSLNLTDYLDHIDAIQPNKSMLYDIVKKHSQVIPYQNTGVYLATSTLDLSIKSLQERLLIKKLGGMCYETSELLWHALTSFGFKAYRTPTTVLNNLPFNEVAPRSHNIIIVFYENIKFLVDVGFGYNSIREPLPFSFTKTEEVLVQGEKYVLTCEDNFYILSMERQNELLTFYRFNKTDDSLPQFIDTDQTAKLYATFINYPGFMRIRDRYILCGKTTEFGRIGFIYDNEEKTFKKLLFDKDNAIKVFLESKEDFEQNIYKELNIFPDFRKLS
ncbi:arylamine N-acetyltransferase-like [Hydra vulgaris]|uniref:arylamine N-acetyltransferase n=1 Tax=Hydra vulgaris TaxID=6087 RepID=A0ABM4D6Q2_HYDVU